MVRIRWLDPAAGRRSRPLTVVQLENYTVGRGDAMKKGL
jgi:hypothetical protein